MKSTKKLLRNTGWHRIKNITEYKIQKNQAALWFLGQAGYIIRSCGTTLAIDPYLSDSVAKAAPDGYTFGMITDSLAINEALGVATPYDAGTDIMPVIKLADVPQMLIVNSNKVPQKSLKDLVTYSKSHPGWFTVGTLGPGSQGNRI